MIFVTVGTQLPFDRLIQAVDEWAGEHPWAEVFAQVGPSEFHPRHIKSEPFLTPDRAEGLFREADLIVSHAGMGSIITALKYKKPILILPRLASLGEHRNDHQLATAKWLGMRKGITVAPSAQEIGRYLDGELQLSPCGEISESADPAFINKLRQEIFQDTHHFPAVSAKKSVNWTWLRH